MKEYGLLKLKYFVSQVFTKYLYLRKNEIHPNYHKTLKHIFCSQYLSVFVEMKPLVARFSMLGSYDKHTYHLSIMGITKPCTHLHPAPSPPPSSLQHPQQYLNQNIARNCAISPNLGRKIKNCPFWLKIGTHGIMKVLIPSPHLDFWNSDPKINFWANLSPKIQSCSFCLKIGVLSISRMLIPNLNLDFKDFDPKIHFWANLGPKIQCYLLCL